jgi:hypothetical protein
MEFYCNLLIEYLIEYLLYFKYLIKGYIISIQHSHSLDKDGVGFICAYVLP